MGRGGGGNWQANERTNARTLSRLCRITERGLGGAATGASEAGSSKEGDRRRMEAVDVTSVWQRAIIYQVCSSRRRPRSSSVLYLSSQSPLFLSPSPPNPLSVSTLSPLGQPAWQGKSSDKFSFSRRRRWWRRRWLRRQRERRPLSFPSRLRLCLPSSFPPFLPLESRHLPRAEKAMRGPKVQCDTEPESQPDMRCDPLCE